MNRAVRLGHEEFRANADDKLNAHNSHRLSLVQILRQLSAFAVVLCCLPALADNTNLDEVRRVATMIDDAIAAQWKAADVVPTHAASDAEFLRRVSLDLTGRIPSVMTTREFLSDPSPEKRLRLIDRLVNDPRSTVHFANFWTDVLIPEAATDLNARYQRPLFEAWLRIQLLDNVSYRRMVQQILAVDVNQNPYSGESTPIAFYTTKETRPENLAAATARMFLGVRIECAQCHNHPFDEWQRKDFWAFAAFYGGLERQRGGPSGILASLREFLGQRKIRIPDTDEFVEPAFLGGEAMPRGSALTPRQALSEWITAEENPYFSQMAVNRMWAHFFGVGFVDPVDNFSSLNPPSHPELLEALAREFREHDYDLKFLMRAITCSKTYQLSSRQTDPSQAVPQLFAKMAVKGLTANQVYDSLMQATGQFQAFSVQNPFVFINSESPQGRIFELFASQNPPTDRPTTILQSLTLMNGEFTVTATDVEKSRLLAAAIAYPDFDTADRVEALFLAALSRPPTERERAKFVAYVDSGGPRQDWTLALGDVFWVLLNSSEFMYNH